MIVIDAQTAKYLTHATYRINHLISESQEKIFFLRIYQQRFSLLLVKVSINLLKTTQESLIV